jgi:hypothetical protein
MEAIPLETGFDLKILSINKQKNGSINKKRKNNQMKSNYHFAFDLNWAE